jgi:hypothetical protein
MKKIMQKNYQLIGRIAVLSAALLLHSCIDVLDLRPATTSKLLVVDGKLTASAGTQLLRLSETSVVGRSANFPPVEGAQITLRDHLGNEGMYEEIEPGVYALDGSVIAGTPGRTYILRIEVNGEVYESLPETMPESVRPDSSFFVVTNGQLLNVYSSIPIPGDIERGPYFKWRSEYVYQLSEYFCHPLQPTKVCFVQQYFSNQLLPILDGSLLARGETARPFVAATEADRRFGETVFFNVYQETLNPDAFTYWNKISLLLTQTGSFFDAPPGAVRGNVINLNKPEEPVLGYFYAAPEDTTRVKVLASDFLPVRINPYCGIPGFPPSPRPAECCGCTLVPNASTIMPPYWY